MYKEYTWVLTVFGKYIGFEVVVVEDAADILLAEHGMGDIQLSHFFRNMYQSGDYHFRSYFRGEPLHYTSANKPDYLSTCFYLLSYLQEYTDYVPDRYGRFPYELSLQKYFNCVEKNLVAAYFDALYEATPKLKALVANKKQHKTKFFLTHDIDFLYAAWRDNAKYLLKHGKLGTLLQLLFNHYLRTPDYMLLDKIMDIEDAYDVKAVFFWLVHYGMGNPKMRNADYSIDEKKVQRIKTKIYERGFVNALHKSISSDTHAKEFQKLGDHLLEVNRNHFLQIELPQGFDGMENSEMQLDSTMGFPERIGFRNNYGLPFRPFKFKERRPYRFIEVPLNVMDTTLKYYNNKNSSSAKNDILDFLDKNKSNCVMTVLWHNNYFFDYSDTGWVDLYKDILQFIKHHTMHAVLPEEILREYSY